VKQPLVDGRKEKQIPHQRIGHQGKHKGDQNSYKSLFSEYDGVDDPLPWLYKCETFILSQITPEKKDKVLLASFHLTGRALTWFMCLETDESTK
jgi:hypothetical protein